MTPGGAADLVLVLLGGALVCSLCGWTRVARSLWPPLAVLLLAGAGLAAALPEDVDTGGNATTTLLVVLAGLVAVCGGGPVTARVFAVVDRADSSPGRPVHTIDRAAEVLRGGAWIGALERAAVFASLATGVPEGVAVVLGLKGLGRYPELRNQDVAGAAERFIIGTFTSVLWAAACAGVVAIAVRG